MDEKENRNYINTKIHPIFERLVIDLLLNKPDEPIDYMMDWLKDKGQQFKQTASAGIQQTSLAQLQQQQSKKPKVEDHLSSEEDDDEEDVVEILPQIKPQQGKPFKMRTSVSAEAYGAFNKKGVFKPRVIPKTQEQRQRIEKRLTQAFMFSALDDKEREIVVLSMEEKKYKPGDFAIRQGDDGGELFIVDSGQLDCFKRFTKDGENKFLKTYQPGESFGELSLLYNAPRAASIKAKTDCVLWSLDRDCFNNIVKDASMKKRDKYENFLKNIELLDTMDPYERSKVADALKVVNCKAGEYVVRQGDQGDMFFMVEEGNLICTKVLQPGIKIKQNKISFKGQPAQKVFQYKTGDYFGELALIKDVPRQANIICETDCILLCLDRYSFKRLLGPIDEILKRNSAKYEKYNK